MSKYYDITILKGRTSFLRTITTSIDLSWSDDHYKKPLSLTKILQSIPLDTSYGHWYSSHSTRNRDTNSATHQIVVMPHFLKIKHFFIMPMQWSSNLNRSTLKEVAQNGHKIKIPQEELRTNQCCGTNIKVRHGITT